MIIWRKPANVGQWLLLLTPALIAIVCALAGQLIGNYEYRRNPSSSAAIAADAPRMFGLVAATIVSLALGLRTAWKNPTLRGSFARTWVGLTTGVIIALVNALIAFPGCYLLSGA
jgi:hypothetical protein